MRDNILPLDVSRETRERLERYIDELRRWQSMQNLVGPSTLADVWRRHVEDSRQLVGLADGDVWADLGSGAGFPGLVVALCRPGTLVHLVESDSRKCAFLRAAIRATGAEARVWDGRIETVLPRIAPAPSVVTARALAPLTDLLALSRDLLTNDATGLFLKGRDHDRELTDARRSWTFDLDVIPSRVDREGRVLRIRRLRPADQVSSPA